MATQIEARPGKYLTFSLREQPYGVPINMVREINRMSDITPVPQAPTYLAGVMNLRGKVVPVVDLRSRLGLEKAEHTKATCIIVIEADFGQVGMIVDSVSGVIELTSEQIEAPPVFGRDRSGDSVMGMGKVDNRVVVLLAIAQTLSNLELKHAETAA